ncbi:MAG: ATP-binding domain-containing protein, partial [SAR324 cluster bacterium]|nr:ATP-binding domain-containing protein [SAR324 cluster bacterium]
RIPERFQFDPKSEVQVITPMHKGLTGAQNLNSRLQQALNPEGEEIVFGDNRFRVGDKVMQTRNDYEKEVFNGDMGEITAYDKDAGLVAVSFDEREVIYERKELDAIALGYAITVHKSQGSEYPAVVLSLTTQHAIMLQRNLLYTAITRARRLLVLLGTEKAVRMALNNVRPEMRHTRLRQRLTMEGEASLHQAAP